MIITLLSDIGTRNASVSVAKAILMQYVPGVTIVDMSHQITPYNLHQAAYVLFAAYSHFPTGTIHIALVDVFAENPPKMILAEHNGYYFISPDNGILQLTFDFALPNTRLCFAPGASCPFTTWIEQTGSVLQKIDQAKGVPLQYPFFASTKAHRPTKPRMNAQGIECYILYVDRFENVVLGINKEQFTELAGNKGFRIRVIGNKDITTIQNVYNDVRQDEAMCRFNDAGFLEIAVNHGSALHKLALNKFSPRELYYQTVNIFLEER